MTEKPFVHSEGRSPLATERLPLADALRKIDRSPTLRSYAPPETRDWFVVGVKQAVECYYELDRPEDVRRELRELEAHCRRPDGALAQRVAGLSQTARDMIWPEIPPIDAFENEEMRAAAAESLRSLLILGGRLERTGGRRRKKIDLLGQGPRGQPRHDNERVLVSFLAAAYAGATGIEPTRLWSDRADEATTAFEDFVEEVFASIAIDDRVNVRNLLKAHVQARRPREGRHE